MNLTFSIKSKKIFNMFGFRSNIGADLAAAAAVVATASCSFVPKRLSGHRNECATQPNRTGRVRGSWLLSAASSSILLMSSCCSSSDRLEEHH